MMTQEEMAKYLALEEKKLAEIKKMNAAIDEYRAKLSIEESVTRFSTIPIETTILTIREAKDNNLGEDKLLEMLEVEKENLYEMEKSFQKVSNFLKDFEETPIPLPLIYLRARTNCIRRLLQEDVAKAFH